jgi:hypothetical protein
MNTRPRDFLKWATDVFGHVALDRNDRLARFVEEAIEVARAEGMSAELIERIFIRVYTRPAGDLAREIAQAQVCLEMYAESIGLSADAEAAREFDRVRSIPAYEWLRRHVAKVKEGIAS